MDWRILYNPLEVLGIRRGFTWAIVIVIVLTAVAWWAGVHLDGALDLHLAPTTPSTALIIVESLIAWLSLGILFFMASRIFGGNSGLAGHLAAAGLGRFPYILAAILGSRQVLGQAMTQGMTVGEETVTVSPDALMSPGLIIGSLLLMAFIIWAVAIMYTGFRHASRIQGGKKIAAFIVGLVLAEIVSKLALTLVFRMGI